MKLGRPTSDYWKLKQTHLPEGEHMFIIMDVNYFLTSILPMAVMIAGCKI